MATIRARWVVKSALFSLFEGLPDLISVVSSLKTLLFGWTSSLKSFKNASLKRVHVQLSGGHSDAMEDSLDAINKQKRIFKMFMIFWTLIKAKMDEEKA